VLSARSESFTRGSGSDEVGECLASFAAAADAVTRQGP
jgi:hypothetical protein